VFCTGCISRRANLNCPDVNLNLQTASSTCKYYLQIPCYRLHFVQQRVSSSLVFQAGSSFEMDAIRATLLYRPCYSRLYCR
jgi:hypothetical protein